MNASFDDDWDLDDLGPVEQAKAKNEKKKDEFDDWLAVSEDKLDEKQEKKESPR